MSVAELLRTGSLEQFNFEMRGNSRFICHNRCRSYFSARHFMTVDKDTLFYISKLNCSKKPHEEDSLDTKKRTEQSRRSLLFWGSISRKKNSKLVQRCGEKRNSTVGRTIARKLFIVFCCGMNKSVRVLDSPPRLNTGSGYSSSSS